MVCFTGENLIKNKMAKIIELIEVYESTGLGIENDPVRRLYQLWTKDGILVLECDCFKDHKASHNNH